MSQFFQDLWESIFTPGPTPSLLVASNVTFACLQLVLLVLLVATYSVHFIVLSSLCAGLWWAVNWFAAELQAAQRAEKEADERARRARSGGADSDTEVEPVTVARAGDAPASGSREVEPLEPRGELKHRLAAPESAPSQGSKSSASTEDEWERVSENENEKDK